METAIQTTAQLPQLAHARNPGMPLDLDWVASVQANTSAIERRCATLGGRRSVKKDFQAAWLLKAISLIDLTTLSGDDTVGRVQRLCAKARQPVSPWMLERLGMQGLTVGAVCVYHDMVETAVRARFPDNADAILKAYGKAAPARAAADIALEVVAHLRLGRLHQRVDGEGCLGRAREVVRRGDGEDPPPLLA